MARSPSKRKCVAHVKRLLDVWTAFALADRGSNHVMIPAISKYDIVQGCTEATTVPDKRSDGIKRRETKAIEYSVIRVSSSCQRKKK